MRFDSPAGENIFDRAKIVGKPAPRIDGPRKTTGTAPYAYERHDVVAGQLYGYPVASAIAKGRIVSMDTEAAAQARGVVGIVTTLEHEPMKELSTFDPVYHFGGDEVLHYHQAIAVVVADTFENARAAANFRLDSADALRRHGTMRMRPCRRPFSLDELIVHPR